MAHRITVGEESRQDADARNLTPSQIAADPAISGSYVRRPNGTTTSAAPLPFVNVRDFGAVGDGLADDATAIQAAINALSTLTTYGGVVSFPPGKYRVTSTITCSGKVRLQGAGGMRYMTSTGFEYPGGSTLVAGTPSMTVLSLDGGGSLAQAGCIIDSLHFDEASQGRTATFVNVRLMNHWTLRNCALTNGGLALKIDAVSNDASWGMVDQCLFYNNVTGIKPVGGNSVPLFKMVGGAIQTKQAGDVGVYSAEQDWFVTLLGIKFDVNGGGKGVHIENALGFKVVACDFELRNVGSTGVGVDIYATGNVTGTTVSECVFSGDDTPEAGVGVAIDGSTSSLKARGIITQGNTYKSLAAGVAIGANVEGTRNYNASVYNCTRYATIASGAKNNVFHGATLDGSFPTSANAILDANGSGTHINHVGKAGDHIYESTNFGGLTPTTWTFLNDTTERNYWSFVSYGDVSARHGVTSFGKYSWGPGNISRDVNLYRIGAKRLGTDNQFQAVDGISGKYLSGAGKTTVVDADFSTTPPDGAEAVHYDTTAGKVYKSVRANGSWKVIAGPI